MDVRRFWRLAPPDAGEPTAVINSAALAEPPGLVARLKPRDGICVASWDPEELVGRVHALGIVTQADSAKSVAVVDWRRISFTVSPNPQGGRSQWTGKPYFEFKEHVAARYRLPAYFADGFAGATESVSGPQPAPTLSSVAPPDISSPERIESKSATPQTNRVAPDGTVFATTARGTFMGNRADRVRWLVCELEFPRNLKKPREYTKLFFLDEAVALSAGYRPCATCRRDRYQAYLAAVQVSGGPAVDRLLNDARKARGHASIGSLPDGTFVALADDDFRVIWQGTLHRWTPAGYVDPVAVADVQADVVPVLTPAPSVAALRNGYRVAMHPSIAHGV